MFYQWIQERLIRQFSYACCDTIEHFQHESLAITRTGLIKHGGERHEKDDRSQIGDRRKYILGWNNADKIKALEADLDEVSQRLTQVKMQIESLERHRTQCVQQKAALQDFMNFIDFVEIDWRSAESARLKLLELKRELEASSDRLKQLKLQLEQIQQEIVGANKQRDSLIREIQTLEDRQTKAKADRCHCESKFQPFSSQLIEAFATQIAAKLRRYSMILETINRDEAEIQDHLQQQFAHQERQREVCCSAITICIHNFKSAFPETAVEMGTNLEALDEYIERKTQIEREDLPRYEKSFKKHITEKITSAITIFKSSLEKQQEEIRQSIDDLNESLRLISYTESTYIKLRCEATHDSEVRDFKKELIHCLGDVIQQSDEDNEQRFHNIQSRLIKRFKEQDRWTNKVTDVRNWLDFSVSERYKLDDSEKEHHTDSSGKSGGQKVKLAYTILASAIAYQFGLNREDPTAKSFRFVVIDEAFSKSDDDNCRYAMELFKNLDLQLLVITPKDRINTIEQYLYSLHFVSNVPEGNYSSIASITIEKYRQNRHISSKVND